MRNEIVLYLEQIDEYLNSRYYDPFYHQDVPKLIESLKVCLITLEKIKEFDEDWTHQECITALRHDEHEAQTAIDLVTSILNKKT